jgi:hypothetical protein
VHLILQPPSNTTPGCALNQLENTLSAFDPRSKPNAQYLSGANTLPQLLFFFFSITTHDSPSPTNHLLATLLANPSGSAFIQWPSMQIQLLD